VGCGAALAVSGIPFDAPVAGVRVGKVDGEYVINPSFDELDRSEIDLVIAGTADSVVMVEGSGEEISEEELLGAMEAGQKAIAEICAVIAELGREAGKPEMEWEPPLEDSDLENRVRETVEPRVSEAMRIADKDERNRTLDRIRDEAAKSFEAELGDAYAQRAGIVKGALKETEKSIMRRQITDQGVRADGRGPKEIRSIEIEVGVLPRTHGSALFTRGSTQSLGTVTLGTKQDQQMIDDLDPKWDKTFMLHYNFPPFSVGEVGRFFTGRREIGHGALAERSLKGLLPPHEEFPYTIRIVSDILESNGSSSMASVCSGSLAMMDASVPIRKACAGIAMGLVKEGEKIVVLSDIIGMEDFLGDMDFKVAGTGDGITGFQMDIKIKGVPFQVLQSALEQAREGRMHILGEMNKVLSAPRETLSRWAPRIISITVPKNKIRDIIGSGGKIIRGLQEDTGAKIDIDDNGVVTIASIEGAGGEEALRRIEAIIEEPEIGKIYEGPVKSIMAFGAFVEILPGRDGLVHISELEYRRVEKVEDVVQEGDIMRVKLIGIDNQGRVKLSRKALLDKPEGYVEPEPREERPRDGERRGGGGRDRGGRDRGRGGRGNR
jgi:polyribonucleotide nucleotidyltransferase